MMKGAWDEPVGAAGSCAESVKAVPDRPPVEGPDQKEWRLVPGAWKRHQPHDILRAVLRIARANPWSN